MTAANDYLLGTHPGESNGDAAIRLGVSRRHIQRIRQQLIADGIVERKAPVTQRPSKELLAQAEALLEGGSGYAEAQKSTGLSYNTLKRHFPGKQLPPHEVRDRMLFGQKFNKVPNTLVQPRRKT